MKKLITTVILATLLCSCASTPRSQSCYNYNDTELVLCERAVDENWSDAKFNKEFDKYMDSIYKSGN